MRLPEREALRFFERFLPAAPARLLEVGDESGTITQALARKGYLLTSLEEGAEDLESLDPGAGYDAILSVQSLHRMQPVDRALARAKDSLREGGLLLADEAAIDRVNVHTARWLYDLEAILVAGGLVLPAAPEHGAERRPLARWRLEHLSDPPLATGHDLLAAARGALELKAVEEAPYLYRYLAARMPPGADPARMPPGADPERALEALFDVESRLIRERDIAAAGLRFVGYNRPLTTS